MSEIANELKIYIEEITQNAAERDRASGKYRRQVKKGDGERRMLRALQQQCNCCYTELCRNNDDSEGEKNNKEKSRFDEIWVKFLQNQWKTPVVWLWNHNQPKAGKIKKTPPKHTVVKLQNSNTRRWKQPEGKTDPPKKRPNSTDSGLLSGNYGSQETMEEHF